MADTTTERPNPVEEPMAKRRKVTSNPRRTGKVICVGDAVFGEVGSGTRSTQFNVRLSVRPIYAEEGDEIHFFHCIEGGDLKREIVSRVDWKRHIAPYIGGSGPNQGHVTVHLIRLA